MGSGLIKESQSGSSGGWDSGCTGGRGGGCSNGDQFLLSMLKINQITSLYSSTMHFSDFSK